MFSLNCSIGEIEWHKLNKKNNLFIESNNFIIDVHGGYDYM